MAITGIVKVFTGGSKSEEKTIPNRYFCSIYKQQMGSNKFKRRNCYKASIR